MQTEAIESSVIARIGYEADLSFLRVVMRDGAIFDVAPVTLKEWQQFQAAPSKGIFWYRVFAARAFISGDKIKSLQTQSGAGASAYNSGASPAFTEIPEQDDCCNKPFARDSRAGKLAGVTAWTCPKCGCDWRARDTGAGVRHWAPDVQFEVFRMHE